MDRAAQLGANADLVRGFITTPLERVIASADGIDYVESSSAQGASTITVHLKLNYDTNAALTQIQAKVAQVRNNLPPYVCVPSQPTTFAGSGYLSSAYAPFSLGADPASGNFSVQDLTLPGGVDAKRFDTRKSMLQAVNEHFDNLARGG